MTMQIGLSPLIRADIASTYDLIVATVGYESRARYVAQTLGPKSIRKCASAFADQQVLSFDTNAAWFRDAGYEITEHDNPLFNQWVRDMIGSLVSSCKEPPVRLCIDVSSMSRYRIAAITAALMTLQSPCSLQADFVYSPAQFTPPHGKSGPIITSEPITPEYAGWPIDPDLPCTAIIGLGYEPDLAVGTLEYLEPGQVWAMRPVGGDPRYQPAIDKSNKLFLDMLTPDRVITYSVDNPYETTRVLHSFLASTLRDTRPVIVPFGPKIFTVCSLLAASMLHPAVGIWRVSSCQFGHPVDRCAEGSIWGIRAIFMHTNQPKDDTTPADLRSPG